MAIPPEPLQEILPHATWVVEAEVVEVLGSGPEVPRISAPAGWTDTGQKVADQRVRLKVTRVLRGQEVQELVVDKPVAAYSLRAGNKGPFLLDGTLPHPVILGRYGPDSYALAKLEAALKG
jgi:hypothetical protein